MSLTRQIALESPGISKIGIGILITIMLFGLFMVGFDQGQLFSLIQGQKAFAVNWLHEFNHDLRHAAGFPCH